MDIISARAVKEQAKQQLSQFLSNEKAVRALGIRAQRLDRAARPATMALGLARQAGNDYRLAVRLQHPQLVDSTQLKRIRELAKDEVDIRFIGAVHKLQVSSLQQKCRPLRIGCSVAHFQVTAGTLGAFVRNPAGDNMILSNNHVLANENAAMNGDAILQPGPFDGGQDPADRIATLASFIQLDFQQPNRVDCATALLDEGVQFDSINLDILGQLTGVRQNDLDVRENVSKIGRTTGATRGAVTAIELDNVVINYDRGDATFNGQVEIEGAGTEPFSQGGDSGSLIIDSAGRAVGLLFAGSSSGGTNGRGLTYANPIQVVLQTLNVTIIT